MFLLILDKNPYKAAELVPDRLKFKQLLELGQLICSAGISDVYKPIKQGKKLQEWVKNHLCWTRVFFCELGIWCCKNIKLKELSKNKLSKIYDNLCDFKTLSFDEPIQTAIFRYVKEYAEFTEYESNSELEIDKCVECYKKYVEWKEKRKNGTL